MTAPHITHFMQPKISCPLCREGLPSSSVDITYLYIKARRPEDPNWGSVSIFAVDPIIQRTGTSVRDPEGIEVHRCGVGSPL
jgi:hypothetical protein